VLADVILRVAVIAFSIVQTLLGLRLVIPFINVPDGFQEYVPTLFSVTDPLIAPFTGFVDFLGIEFADLGPAGAVGGGVFDRLDVSVIVALIGWSLVELVIVMVLRVVARASQG
jgi:hypothetical protein